MANGERNCADILEALSAYIDLDLPPEACRDIESHLSGCGPCSELAETLRKTLDLCRQYRPEDLPRPLGESAREQLMSAWKRALDGRK